MPVTEMSFEPKSLPEARRQGGGSLAGLVWRYRLLLRFVALLALGPGLALGAWLVLKDDGSLRNRGDWTLIRWYNGSGELRNVPAFLLLGFFALSAFPFRWRRVVLLGLLVVSSGLELGQLWVPTRCFDLVDIGLSWIGILFALILHQQIRDRCRRS